MQEEVTDRAVQVTIQTTKLTGGVLQSALEKVLAHIKSKQLNVILTQAELLIMSSPTKTRRRSVTKTVKLWAGPAPAKPVSG